MTLSEHQIFNVLYLYYFRRLQCHDCVELKKKVNNINEKMTEDNAKLQKQVDELSEKISKMCEMQTEVLMKVTEMMTEVKHLKEMSPGQQLVRSIIIAGGWNGNAYISSVEIFSWSQKTWTLLNPMSTCHAYASAVTYQGEVIISGGYRDKKSTNTMETSSCDKSVKWKISPVKLPEVCHRHAAVMYKDSLVLSGGKIGSGANEVSDKIYKISMVPPYSTKVLTTMPQPRYDHTMELFEDKLFIIGGYDRGARDTVMRYNLVTKEWKMMTPLPFAVDEMATVLWQNNVIVLGGTDFRDTVVMYNLTTGESKYLPSMKHKRQGCAAVITGDVLVVMGGSNSESSYLKSAEAFHFQDQVWEELPDMNEARQYASAVVKPN